MSNDMVLKQDDLGVATGAFDERDDFATNGLREAKAWFGIRDEDGLDAAHHDLVRAGATLGEFAGARGAEDLVDRDRMDVTDAADAGQGEQVGVEEGLDRRLLGVRVDAGGEKGLVDFDVGGGVCVQEREQAGERAPRHIGILERGEVGSGSLDREGVVIESHRGVAFSEDRHAQALTAQRMGQF
jgi:hypothetical protein